MVSTVEALLDHGQDLEEVRQIQEQEAETKKERKQRERRRKADSNGHAKAQQSSSSSSSSSSLAATKNGKDKPKLSVVTQVTAPKTPLSKSEGKKFRAALRDCEKQKDGFRPARAWIISHPKLAYGVAMELEKVVKQPSLSGKGGKKIMVLRLVDEVLSKCAVLRKEGKEIRFDFAQNWSTFIGNVFALCAAPSEPAAVRKLVQRTLERWKDKDQLPAEELQLVQRRVAQAHTMAVSPSKATVKSPPASLFPSQATLDKQKRNDIDNDELTTATDSQVSSLSTSTAEATEKSASVEKGREDPKHTGESRDRLLDAWDRDWRDREPRNAPPYDRTYRSRSPPRRRGPPRSPSPLRRRPRAESTPDRQRDQGREKRRGERDPRGASDSSKRPRANSEQQPLSKSQKKRRKKKLRMQKALEDKQTSNASPSTSGNTSNNAKQGGNQDKNGVAAKNAASKNAADKATEQTLKAAAAAEEAVSGASLDSMLDYD
ncbi:CID domain-containing protein [Durusdinium trenchii]|uniref:CID domain-containing protein n=1 Tax=Durusdinium trenchii TaxID=1381693 RepID=A0ABP0IUK4_9DINO